MKNRFWALTASSLLASAFFITPALAESIVVDATDTFASVAAEYRTTPEELRALNHLTGDTLPVGKRLIVSKEQRETRPAAKSAPARSAYTVEKGDTLFSIARKHRVSVAAIRKNNRLSGDLIRVGQILYLSSPPASSRPAAADAAEASDDTRTRLLQAAKKQLGVPYQWGGTSPRGFDCSGFIHYVLKQQGLSSSRLTTEGYWAKVTKIRSPQPGDLVFFQNTYKRGPSHIGFVLGNGQFIHASSRGIAIDSISSSYWRKHFLGYGTAVQ